MIQEADKPIQFVKREKLVIRYQKMYAVRMICQGRARRLRFATKTATEAEIYGRQVAARYLRIFGTISAQTPDPVPAPKIEREHVEVPSI
jgi:hypothetical protein